MIDAFVDVAAGLFFVLIRIITDPNLHLCMWCNKFRHKSTKGNSSICYEEK